MTAGLGRFRIANPDSIHTKNTYVGAAQAIGGKQPTPDTSLVPESSQALLQRPDASVRCANNNGSPHHDTWFSCPGVTVDWASGNIWASYPSSISLLPRSTQCLAVSVASTLGVQLRLYNRSETVQSQCIQTVSTTMPSLTINVQLLVLT
jgi:hypothetical protein